MMVACLALPSHHLVIRVSHVVMWYKHIYTDGRSVRSARKLCSGVSGEAAELQGWKPGATNWRHADKRDFCARCQSNLFSKHQMSRLLQSISTSFLSHSDQNEKLLCLQPTVSRFG
jgi:hypothetical protein